jgi:hypothetical protein
MGQRQQWRSNDKMSTIQTGKQAMVKSVSSGRLQTLPKGKARRL